MSELTQCNHCSLERIKRRAKQSNRRVVILPARKKDDFFMGGVDVFTFPSVFWTVPQFKKLSYDEQQKWFDAWFMQLADHCCC